MELTADTQDFINDDKLPLDKRLSKRLIEKMGGEDYFIQNYEKVNLFGASTGFKGISSLTDILTFFDANRDLLYDLMGVMGAKRCCGEVEYIKEIINKRDFDMNRVQIGLDEVAGEDIEDCSVERSMVAHWSVWHAAELLSYGYAKHLAAQKVD